VVEAPVLLGVALGCLVASAIWGRSALRLERSWRRIKEASGPGSAVAADLVRSAYRRELHNTLLYAIAALTAALGAVTRNVWFNLPRLLLAVPIGMTIVYGRKFMQEADLIEERASLERKAEETLSQEELAPKRWAARLAPQDLPGFEGFEIGRVYEAGTGLMAGDFYDLFPVGP
jgi:hypothetical protein